MAISVTDPVCGRDVDPDDAEFVSEYDGDTYYFCSEECQDEFDSDPARYAARSPLSEAGVGGDYD